MRVQLVVYACVQQERRVIRNIVKGNSIPRLSASNIVAMLATITIVNTEAGHAHS